MARCPVLSDVVNNVRIQQEGALAAIRIFRNVMEEKRDWIRRTNSQETRGCSASESSKSARLE